MVSCDLSGQVDTKSLFYNFCILKMSVVRRERLSRHRKCLYILSFENGSHATRTIG